MSLLAAYDLRLQFQSKVLFDGASVGIESGDRVGLVGPNGTGKSTLIKILIGQVEPESGRVVRARGLRVGHLPQEIPAPRDVPLFESVLAGAPHRAQIEERLAAAQDEVAGEDDPDRQIALARQVADLTLELTELDRRFAPHRAARILSGLGFAPSDLERPLPEFSGGWRMRAALAGLLFQQPDVLLLDEPTNHLDLPSVHWLQRFLDGFAAALVLICHDRQFLNRHVNRILALEPEGVRAYRGDYDAYLAQRTLEEEHRDARAARDERRRKDLEAFVTRFKAKASKARQAQSKAKLIEKLQAGMPPPRAARKTMRMQLPPADRCGDPALECEDTGHAYAGQPVFSGCDLVVRPGERVAIVGRNGAGKTTLLRILAGELAPAAGQVRRGHNVTLGYFAQHHADQLRADRSILEEVARAAPDLTPGAVRSVCGAFLFTGDEVEKPVGVLSGGEKTRVALARLLARPGNVLLLDEPTNHLDTESAERLTESLEEFDGAVVFVSHNLDFTRRLANRVVVVEEGRVHRFPGSFEDYLTRLQSEEDARDGGDAAPGTRADVRDRGAAASDKAARIRARGEDQQRKKDRQKLERRVAALEREIEALERHKRELEQLLVDPGLWDDRDRADAVTRDHERARAELEGKLAAWARDSALLDAAG